MRLSTVVTRTGVSSKTDRLGNFPIEDTTCASLHARGNRCQSNPHKPSTHIDLHPRPTETDSLPNPLRVSDAIRQAFNIDHAALIVRTIRRGRLHHDRPACFLAFSIQTSNARCLPSCSPTRAMISIGSVRCPSLVLCARLRLHLTGWQGVGLARGPIRGIRTPTRGPSGLRTAGVSPMIVGRGIGLTCHRRRGADGQIATPTTIRFPKSAQCGRWAGSPSQ
jgi:hypothetical protein